MNNVDNNKILIERFQRQETFLIENNLFKKIYLKKMLF